MQPLRNAQFDYKFQSSPHKITFTINAIVQLNIDIIFKKQQTKS